MKTGIIIQARMGSTRLPGKVLMKIIDQPVLLHVVNRLKQVTRADSIIVATTTDAKDQPIVDFCISKGISYFTGSEDNVLERYYACAKAFGLDYIVRITSDCPLIDPLIVDQMIEVMLTAHYDLVTNVSADISLRTYPRGLDTEITTFSQLQTAYQLADKTYYKEHVMPYIYEHADKIYYFKNDKDYSKYRITLDTPEDFQLIQTIYESLYDESHHFYLKEIVHLFETTPSLVAINQMIEQKKI